MKTKTSKRFAPAALAALALAAGCTTPTQYIRPGVRTPNAAGIVDQDVRAAAAELTASLLESGILDRTDGAAYVIAIGRVVNDTMQHLDTDILVDQIKEDLTATGKVLVTAAYTGAPDKPARVDSTLQATRSARTDPEFNRATVVDEGRLVAASLSLSGRISQRDTPTDGGKKQVDYYFQMRVVDQATGLERWSKQIYVGKITSRRNQTW